MAIASAVCGEETISEVLEIKQSNVLKKSDEAQFIVVVLTMMETFRMEHGRELLVRNLLEEIGMLRDVNEDMMISLNSRSKKIGETYTPMRNTESKIVGCNA
ncbi:hypothetical protein JTB14_003253 [Gonioctena quinquepunctata]|nr:hypothetical protein JTB14_003253 [Gonioctena quinquepunctata]